MSEEHRNGFTCEDAEDRIDDLESELSECHRSLARIETWLGITDELDVARLQAAMTSDLDRIEALRLQRLVLTSLSPTMTLPSRA